VAKFSVDANVRTIMSKLDQYIHAATRDNTRRSYQSAVRHFEVEWGGFLPATADSVARYLVDHAETLSINTLRQRIAALAQWHIDQGFPDPTKTPVVRKVFRGIQALHPAQEKQAKPLQLEQLEQVVQWLDQAIASAIQTNDHAAQRRHKRDKALVLLGFWRGFRGDELTRLQVQHIEVVPGEGMTCFLPQTKGDRQHKGTHFKAPALSKLCPVTAYTEWIDFVGLTEGSVFRSVDRGGNVNNDGLHTNSLVPLLRSLFNHAGISSAKLYSGHSLRRGFANWATSNGWDIKTLMQYVGWKNVQSALRYVDSADPFAQHRIETALPASPPAAAIPISLQPSVRVLGEQATITLQATISLEPYTGQVRGLKRAQNQIEEFCFAPHQMRRMDKKGKRYQLTVAYLSKDGLEETMSAMIDEIHRIATNHQCFIEVSIHDAASKRHWN
jgi:integrase